jgi:hypothetical protein
MSFLFFDLPNKLSIFSTGNFFGGTKSLLRKVFKLNNDILLKKMRCHCSSLEEAEKETDAEHFFIIFVFCGVFTFVIFQVPESGS